jgi:hypothetical protein
MTVVAVHRGLGNGQPVRVVEHQQLHVFEHESGTWWARCKICRVWTSTSNETRDAAEKEIGQHFRNEHAPEGRSGVVFIAWTEGDDEPGFDWGYWDGAPEGGLLEQMPETAAVDVALEWGRARSDRVKIRPSWDPARYYSAGTRTMPGESVLHFPDDD